MLLDPSFVLHTPRLILSVKLSLTFGCAALKFFIFSRNPRTDLSPAPALAEAAAPPLELAFTPSLLAAAVLAPKDEGTVLDRSCKELLS